MRLFLTVLWLLDWDRACQMLGRLELFLCSKQDRCDLLSPSLHQIMLLLLSAKQKRHAPLLPRAPAYMCGLSHMAACAHGNRQYASLQNSGTSSSQQHQRVCL